MNVPYYQIIAFEENPTPTFTAEELGGFYEGTLRIACGEKRIAFLDCEQAVILIADSEDLLQQIVAEYVKGSAQLAPGLN